jgi:hypothetical protein
MKNIDEDRLERDPQSIRSRPAGNSRKAFSASS